VPRSPASNSKGDPIGPTRSRWTGSGLRALGLTSALALGLSIGPPACRAIASTLASVDSQRIGTLGALRPDAGSLLVDYYEAFLRDRDIEAFRRNVSSRYNEGTLARVLQAGEPQARRASVLALGLFGGFGSNAAVARGLRDPDPTVRALADNALWAIWFRADTPENNEALEGVRALVNRRRFDLAIEQADRLIARSPTFAEAYNQRAIAHFFQGQFAESVEDCKRALAHNPYHTGALAGMGQCLLQLGRRDEAIQTFRRALQIQPYNLGLRETIAELGAGGR
jgi:tetratricopeptide (TPR) repeat protein